MQLLAVGLCCGYRQNPYRQVYLIGNAPGQLLWANETLSIEAVESQNFRALSYNVSSIVA